MQSSQRLRWATLAAGLWWGSLSALCAVVVPLLFMHAPSVQVAGSLAARLFSAQTWIGTVCALVILMAFNRVEDEDLLSRARFLVRWVVAALLAALLLELALAPRIMAARGDVQALRLWHGLGSGLMLAQWSCVSAAFWQLARR